jgi:tol-pal system beta propeller repeat protein TolB
MWISTHRFLIWSVIFVLTTAGLSVSAAPHSRQATAAPIYLPVVRAADHSKIAFVGIRSGAIHTELFVLSPPDGPPVALPNSCGTDAYAPAWAPDGQRLAFVTSDNPRILCIINADGSHTVHVLQSMFTYGARDLAWSPDGSQIALSAEPDMNLDHREIVLINVDGTNPRRLTPTTQSDWSPSWSPDGHELVFASARSSGPGIYRMNADGSNQQRIAGTDAHDFDPVWSPDGQRIAFGSSRNLAFGSRIYAMDVDGQNVKQVTHTVNAVSFTESEPTWSPDSLRIAYTVQEQMVHASAVLFGNIDGSEPPTSVNIAWSATPEWSRR